MQKPSFLAAPLSTAGPRADHVFGTLQYREDVRLRVCAGRPLPSNTGLVESKVKAAYSAKAAVLPENTPRNRYAVLSKSYILRLLVHSDTLISCHTIAPAFFFLPTAADLQKTPTSMHLGSKSPYRWTPGVVQQGCGLHLKHHSTRLYTTFYPCSSRRHLRMRDTTSLK